MQQGDSLYAGVAAASAVAADRIFMPVKQNRGYAKVRKQE
jgi:hypothetical protein